MYTIQGINTTQQTNTLPPLPPNQKVNTSKTIGNEIQKMIYGQRDREKDKLSAVDIHTIFQDKFTNEFNLIIYKGLQQKVLDPDITILQAITKSKNKDYLITIALCLRFGADANMYVNAPNLGIIHILGYVYITLSGNDNITNSSDLMIINTIVLMLLISGARPSMPMFDKNAGQISNTDKLIPSTLSVKEWLDDRGYITILDKLNIGEYSQLQEYVDKESLVLLSILLDNPALAARKYQSSDIFFAIKSFSEIVIDMIPVSNLKLGLDYKTLESAITYVNNNAFNKFLDKGQFPSYIMINKILIAMQKSKADNNIIAFQEYEKMLIESVKYGIELDQDQYAMISSLGADTLSNVTREYDKPLWEKICKSPPASDTPEELKMIAVSLNIDPTLSKTGICEKIKNITIADKDVLKEAARKRQQYRMASTIGGVNEFLGDNVPVYTCQNKSLLQHDPFDYNDFDLAYYKDDQGVIWCFSSNSYATLLETKINPHNYTKLPDSFLDQIKIQSQSLKKMGVDVDHGEIGIYNSRIPLTFTQAIDNLSAKDTIKEKYSKKSYDNFVQLAIMNGLNPDSIKSLNKSQLSNALNSIDYKTDLNDISTNHAIITTSKIIDEVNKISPNLIPIFFNSLKNPVLF